MRMPRAMYSRAAKLASPFAFSSPGDERYFMVKVVHISFKGFCLAARASIMTQRVLSYLSFPQRRQQ